MKCMKNALENFIFICNDYQCKIMFILNLTILTRSLVCLFAFVALRPMSTAMVIAGRSVHLTTLFPGQA